MKRSIVASMRSVVAATGYALVLGLAPGCAASADRLRADIEVVRKETTPDVLVAKGDAYEAAGDPMRAAQYFTAARAAGGDEATLVRRVVRAYVVDKQFRAALDCAEGYLRHHPDDQPVRFAHATVSAALGETEAARSDFMHLVQASPDNPDFHFAFAVFLRDRLGDDTQAREQFASYLRLAPDGPRVEEARAGSFATVAP